jgi:hypothetical protein
MEFTFIPKFEKKLQKYGIKDTFLHHIVEYNDYQKDPVEFVEEYLQDLQGLRDTTVARTWKNFITRAFVWARTPEGHDYWEKISLK